MQLCCGETELANQKIIARPTTFSAILEEFCYFPFEQVHLINMTAGLEKACHRCLSKVASNAYFVVGLLAFLALPLTMALVGAKNIDECPVQPMIPLYLLVGGVVGSIKVSLLLYDIMHIRSLISKSVVIGDDDADEYPWRQNAHRYYVHVILSIFLFVWFLLANYWVFSVYTPNFIAPFHQPHEYCRKSLYMFAVFVLGLSHIVLVLLLCCGVWMRVCHRTSTRNDYGDDDDDDDDDHD
ncbi:transmembrane protein 272-like [Alosa sapidissima]|uniref:transmembrane protein 272-like n=1 Tax=Alosa sapidissima TaxID=34773 RepID=UPI001C09D669|nr:transmembrane protein 272-like [Alosa sapidissima]